MVVRVTECRVKECRVQECRVRTPGGNLFVRIWRPSVSEASDAPQWPVPPSPSQHSPTPPSPTPPPSEAVPGAAPSVLADAALQGAIVLLHDSLGSVDLWRDFPATLAQTTGKPVVAYDRLGYGQSDAAQGLPPPDFVAREGHVGLKPVLDALNLERAILLGHSVGGGMAVNAAVQMPERIIGVVTIAAQAFPEDRTLKAIAEAKEQFKEEAQLARLRKYHGDKARWVVDAWTDSWLSPAFASWHVRDVLPQVKCPLLALHGEHDEYGTAVHPQIYSELSGGPSRMVLIPGAYHLPHREAPEPVAAMVHAFMAEHGPQVGLAAPPMPA